MCALMHGCTKVESVSREFDEWLERVTNSASVRAIAARAGLEQTKVRRHLLAPAPNPATVVAIARAYGASPTQGLVAAGLLTEDEVAAGEAEIALARAGDHRLMLEIMRRVDSAPGQHQDLEGPVQATDEEMAKLRATTSRVRGSTARPDPDVPQALAAHLDQHSSYAADADPPLPDFSKLAARRGVPEGLRQQRELDAQYDGPDPDGPEGGA